MTQLASQLFAVGQMVGKDGANFQYTGGGGSYSPNFSGRSAGAGGSNEGLAKAAGLLGQSMAGEGGSSAAGMSDGSLVSGDIKNPSYSNDYSLTGAAKTNNTQYGLMPPAQSEPIVEMQYNPQTPQQGPYGLQNTQGLNYQQPSGWSTFFQ